MEYPVTCPEVLKRIADGIRRHGVVEASVRFLDHLLSPRGISPMGLLGWNVVDGPAGAAEEHFEKIAEQSAWGSQESISGPGSELGYTEGYRLALADLLTRRGMTSVFDAPCGDLNWIALMLNQVSVRYIGADISETVVKSALNRHPDKTIIKLDITSDIFPSAQLWHCRDCMFHLSYLDIRKAIENFLRSDCEYALLTRHKGLIRNFDIRTGGWRYLDLRRAPFNLPAPIEELRDYRSGIDHPRYVGLWSQGQLARAFTS